MIRRSLLLLPRTPLRCAICPGRSQRIVLRTRPRAATSPFSQFHPNGFRTYQYQHQPPQPLRLGPSRKVRFVRSVIWAFVFFNVGAAAAILFRLGAYIRQSRLRVDSAADNELAQETMEQINQHPAIQALNENPDFEEIFPLATTPELTKTIQSNTPWSRRIHHFIYTALRGTRGVFPRAFYCASRGILVMVVGFGYGTEGPIGTLHNGVAATMVQESMRLLAQAWFPPDVAYKLCNLHMYFSIPLVPNGIYCITVMPASTVSNLESVVNEHRSKRDPAPGKDTSTIWPSWFDPSDWHQNFNTMIARASMYDGNPLDEACPVIVNCVGRFEVEHSETWPPSKHLQQDQIDDDT